MYYQVLLSYNFYSHSKSPKYKIESSGLKLFMSILIKRKKATSTSQ